ncbi:hypothetical protein HYT25_00965 [Candidatus Pacearchaeota archaeon]|nr:hypothetical protein [Candidatus Pacearchaeota archaeon]
MEGKTLEETVKSKIEGVIRLCLIDDSNEHIKKEMAEVITLIGNASELKEYRNEIYHSIKTRLNKRDYEGLLSDVINLANSFGVTDSPAIQGYSESQEELIIEPLE